MTDRSVITRLRLERFTAFEKLDIHFSPGLNVIIGANSTGKTHVLKVLYSACKAMKEVSGESFGDKLVKNFLPLDGRVGRLVKRGVGRAKGMVRVNCGASWINAEFSTVMKNGATARVSSGGKWFEIGQEAAFIPVKEMLAHAPGFRSLYQTRAVSYEEIYADLLDLAYLPILRGPKDQARKKLMKTIEGAVEGKVLMEGEQFFLKDNQGKLEFSLLAEGLRKFALLWLLIHNGTLNSGNVLFWDEPETNLNPKLQGKIVEILLELQRAGVQVFIATHNYVLLKEIHLRMKRDKNGKVADKVMFHSLYHENKLLKVASTDDYLRITPNVIQETFMDLYDRDVKRVLGVKGS